MKIGHNCRSATIVVLEDMFDPNARSTLLILKVGKSNPFVPPSLLLQEGDQCGAGNNNPRMKALLSAFVAFVTGHDESDETVQFNEQTSVCSRIIEALKNPVSPLTFYLLHSSKNPVSLLMIHPGSYCTFFVKVSPGRACNDYNNTFCVDVK
jgi:hypothetical protein